MSLFDAFRIPSMIEIDRYELEVRQTAIQFSLESLENYCNDVIAKCNIIENRKNLREAMTTDERLDIVNTRMKMEMFLKELATLKS